MRRQNITALTLILASGGVVAGASAQAPAPAGQAPLTIVGGFFLHSWNAGTSTPGRIDWPSERNGTGWSDSLTWNWKNVDGMGAAISPAIEPVFDARVPGITGAYRFPAAKAADTLANGLPRAGWEFQAQVGVPGTFELWFKPADLTGTHVLWELGGGSRGVAFALEDDELLFALATTDGPVAEPTTNIVEFSHRQTLTDTEWHQAVIVIDQLTFTINAYFDGQLVNSMSFPPSASYRWSGGNPAGLGMLGTDPLFPDATIAGEFIPANAFTDYDGWISTIRYYNLDLFASEVLNNYNALTDAAATMRRGDFNGDELIDADDEIDYLSFMDATDTAPVTAARLPFPGTTGGSLQTNDPALDEGYVGDFDWDRDDGFNPPAGTFQQEPTFQFPLVNTLIPVPVNDPAFPSIRRAYVMDGDEGLRGPRTEQLDDNFNAAHVQFWMYVDDLVGNHCLFKAGPETLGFSIVTRGDEIAGEINTNATDGLDLVEISSGPGVLETGWHRFDVVIRRFAGSGVGQGYELYMDGQQVAAINDQPGPDLMFGTADDVNVFTPAGTGNAVFTGGGPSSYGTVTTANAALPFGWTVADLTPFNGLVGPIRIAQGQPLPDAIAASFAADAAQNVINLRGDINRDGQANYFDVLDQLKLIEAAE